MAKESFWRDVPKLNLKSYWKCTVMHAHMCETEKLEKNNTPNWSVNHWILKTDSFHTVRSFLLILSDKVFHKLHGFYHGGNRWATPVRHNGGRGFSNGRVPVTSKSSQFKQQTLTPCNRSFGWVPFGRFFQFLHDFIFQKKITLTCSIWIHLAPLPPFMLPNSPLLLPLSLVELFFFNHGFGSPVYDGEIQDVRPWGGSEAFSKNAKRSPTHVGIMLHIFKKNYHDIVMSCIHNTCWNVDMYIYNKSWLIIPAYIGSNIGMVRWISGTRNMRSVEMSRMLPVNLLRKDRRYPCFAKSTSDVLKIFPTTSEKSTSGLNKQLSPQHRFRQLMGDWLWVRSLYRSLHFIWDMVVLKDLSYAKKRLPFDDFFGSTGMIFLGKSWHQHRIYAQKTWNDSPEITSMTKIESPTFGTAWLI